MKASHFLFYEFMPSKVAHATVTFVTWITFWFHRHSLRTSDITWYCFVSSHILCLIHLKIRRVSLSGCQLPTTISPDMRFWPNVWADLFYSIVVRLTKKWVSRKVEDELLSCRKCPSMPIRQCRHQVCDKATVFSFRTDFFTETSLNSTSLKTFLAETQWQGVKQGCISNPRVGS